MSERLSEPCPTYHQVCATSPPTSLPSSSPSSLPTILICDAGTFLKAAAHSSSNDTQLNTTSYACVGCASGRVSAGGFSTSCSDCPIGDFPNSDQSECQACGAGFETNQNSSTGEDCAPCAEGRYSDGLRERACRDCDVSPTRK